MGGVMTLTTPTFSEFQWSGFSDKWMFFLYYLQYQKYSAVPSIGAGEQRPPENLS